MMFLACNELIVIIFLVTPKSLCLFHTFMQGSVPFVNTLWGASREGDRRVERAEGGLVPMGYSAPDGVGPALSKLQKTEWKNRVLTESTPTVPLSPLSTLP